MAKNWPAVTCAVLAGLFVLPSYAAFTPAVLLALLVLLIASYPAYKGAFVASVVTLVLVSAAVIVSPIFEIRTLQENTVLALFLIVPYAVFLICLAKGFARRNASH